MAARRLRRSRRHGSDLSAAPAPSDGFVPPDRAVRPMGCDGASMLGTTGSVASHPILHGLARCLLLAASMFWIVLWALVLGFARSAVVRVLLSRRQAEQEFGKTGPREVALAAAWGAISFSTSYAAVAMARTLFKKGGSLPCALVFLFASTNLSLEFLLV